MYNRNCTVDGGDGENKQPKAKEKGNAHIKCVGLILSLVLGEVLHSFFFFLLLTFVPNFGIFLLFPLLFYVVLIAYLNR